MAASNLLPITEALFESSDSDTSSDDEIFLFARQKRTELPRIHNFAENTVLDMTVEDFRSHFRLYPSTVDFLENKVNIMFN